MICLQEVISIQKLITFITKTETTVAAFLPSPPPPWRQGPLERRRATEISLSAGSIFSLLLRLPASPEKRDRTAAAAYRMGKPATTHRSGAAAARGTGVLQER